MVSGEFGANEPLNAFSNAVVSSGARVIVFNSPGGNVGTAIQLGRMIRAAGLDTLQVRQLQCASACSLAFLGGVRRVAETGSIGVHRASFDTNSGMSADEAVAQIQAGTAQVMSYMTEMGVDPKLMQVALSYDRSDMRYLSASEMAELRVTNVAVSLPPVDTSLLPPRPNTAPKKSTTSQETQNPAPVVRAKPSREQREAADPGPAPKSKTAARKSRYRTCSGIDGTFEVPASQRCPLSGYAHY